MLKVKTACHHCHLTLVPLIRFWPVFPAGFYYKTFMWPAAMWMKYEHVIRHAAGLGKAADDHNDPDRYEKPMRIAMFWWLAAVAVAMAALQAGRSGARVIIADEQNEFGGWLLGEAIFH